MSNMSLIEAIEKNDLLEYVNNLTEIKHIIFNELYQIFVLNKDKTNKKTTLFNWFNKNTICFIELVNEIDEFSKLKLTSDYLEIYANLSNESEVIKKKLKIKIDSNVFTHPIRERKDYYFEWDGYVVTLKIDYKSKGQQVVDNI